MPEALPEHERLGVWEYVIDTDWIHGYEDPDEIGRWIGVLQGRGSMLADHLPTIVGRIFLRKSVAFDAQFGFSEAMPRVSRRNFDFEAACRGVIAANGLSAEAGALYQSLVSLAMLSQQVMPDEATSNR
jgi:hypothetical protein